MNVSTDERDGVGESNTKKDLKVEIRRFLLDSRTERVLRFATLIIGFCFWSFLNADSPALNSPLVLLTIVSVSVPTGFIGLSNALAVLLCIAFALAFAVASYLLLILVDHGENWFFVTLVCSLILFIPMLLSETAVGGNVFTFLMLTSSNAVFPLLGLVQQIPVELQPSVPSGSQILSVFWSSPDLSSAVFRNGFISSVIGALSLAVASWLPPWHFATDMYTISAENFLRGMSANLRALCADKAQQPVSPVQLDALLGAIGALAPLSFFEISLWPLGGVALPVKSTTRLNKLLSSILIAHKSVLWLESKSNTKFNHTGRILINSTADILELLASSVKHIGGTVVCNDITQEMREILAPEAVIFQEHSKALADYKHQYLSAPDIHDQCIEEIEREETQVILELLKVSPLLVADVNLLNWLRETILKLICERQQSSPIGLVMNWVLPIVLIPVYILSIYIKPILSPISTLKRTYRDNWLNYTVRKFIAIIIALALMTYVPSYQTLIFPEVFNKVGGWMMVGVNSSTQSTFELTVKKGILRCLGTTIGAFLAYGFLVLAGNDNIPAVLISFTSAFLLLMVWILPPGIPSSYNIPLGGVYMYSCASFTYVIVASSPYILSSNEARLDFALARYVAQMIGIGLAIALACILPVSQYRTSRRTIANNLRAIPEILHGIIDEIREPARKKESSSSDAQQSVLKSILAPFRTKRILTEGLEEPYSADEYDVASDPLSSDPRVVMISHLEERIRFQKKQEITLENTLKVSTKVPILGPLIGKDESISDLFHQVEMCNVVAYLLTSAGIPFARLKDENLKNEVVSEMETYVNVLSRIMELNAKWIESEARGAKVLRRFGIGSELREISEIQIIRSELLMAFERVFETKSKYENSISVEVFYTALLVLTHGVKTLGPAYSETHG